eukprot:gb/GEZN01003170.1/.p1 GENE.gb/GEZN01003170.1/~~gb/GEZN01003170.1/.p1  ORF type:complete len:436 (+),score=45.81 gb/GEZN01003170.1/:28-1335(+)
MGSGAQTLRFMARKMKQVYGPPTSAVFPKPNREAGHSMVPYTAGVSAQETQRRYLWTDAFAVLNYCTLAVRSQNREERELYVSAAKKLIHTTHRVLGNPPSAALPMSPWTGRGSQFQAHGSGSLSKNLGLRIGKERARKETDYGMELDGMYFHYLDKWLFALVRFSQVSKDVRYLVDATLLIMQIHPHFMVYHNAKPFAIRWKTNIDISPIKGVHSRPGSDSLSACVVYHLVDAHLKEQKVKVVVDNEELDISKECDDVRQAAELLLNQIGCPASHDPLGFGLQWWELQWVRGSASQRMRDELLAVHGSALHPLHMSLPFRLYGALLGAQLSDSKEVRKTGESLLKFCLAQHRQRAMQGEGGANRASPSGMTGTEGDDKDKEEIPLGEAWDCSHWAINSVMLVACLDTWAWQAQLEKKAVSGMPGVIGCESVLQF